MTLDEQIAGIKHLSETDSTLANKYWASVLASLEELKRIREVQVLEEPYIWEVCGERWIRKEGYDTLRDLLKQCKHNSSVTMDELGEMRERAEAAEAEADKQFQYAGRVLEQAHAAEATISAMLKLGENPSEEMMQDGYPPNSDEAMSWGVDEVFKAMFAKLVEQSKEQSNG